MVLEGVCLCRGGGVALDGFSALFCAVAWHGVENRYRKVQHLRWTQVCGGLECDLPL